MKEKTRVKHIWNPDEGCYLYSRSIEYRKRHFLRRLLQRLKSCFFILFENNPYVFHHNLSLPYWKKFGRMELRFYPKKSEEEEEKEKVA